MRRLRSHWIGAAASAADLPAIGTAEAPLRSVRRMAPPVARTHELWAGVHLSEFDPAQGLEALATRAQRFTPRVSLAPPDGLLLEVAGSLHLFAGVAGLRRELVEECLRLRVRPVFLMQRKAVHRLRPQARAQAIDETTALLTRFTAVLTGLPEAAAGRPLWQ